MSGVEIVFVVVATILFGFLFLIWQKSDWFNLLLKASFFVMTIIGVLIIYDQRIFF